MSDDEPKTLHLWVDPPETPLPLNQSPVRVAVGTPTGRSTNSWRVWTQGQDVYVKCRDNLREIKVSLHASGIWRVGFAGDFIRTRPDFLPEGQDRVWKKWHPSFTEAKRTIIGIQLVALTPTLHLGPKDRRSWPTSVVFIEPSANRDRMTVLSVAVVQSRNMLRMSEDTHGAVVAVLPLGEERSVQLVATYEEPGNVNELVEEAFRRTASQLEGSDKLPDEGLFFVQGNVGDIPWVTTVPFQRNTQTIP